MTTTIPGHPVTSSSDWLAFKRDFSRFHLAEVIERSAITLPRHVAPFAHGVATLSEVLLKKAGYRPGCYRRSGWEPNGPEEFRTTYYPRNTFIARKQGSEWYMLRQIDDDPEEILVYRFGSTPIVSRNYQAATRFLNLGAFGLPSCMNWVTAVPEGALPE